MGCGSSNLPFRNPKIYNTFSITYPTTSQRHSRISKYLIQQPITVRSNLPNWWGKRGSISRGYLERPRNDHLGSGPHSKRGNAPAQRAPLRAPSLGLFNMAQPCSTQEITAPRVPKTGMEFVIFGKKELHFRSSLLNMKTFFHCVCFK